MMLEHILKLKDTMLTETFRGKAMERGPSSWRNNEETNYFRRLLRSWELYSY